MRPARLHARWEQPRKLLDAPRGVPSRALAFLRPWRRPRAARVPLAPVLRGLWPRQRCVAALVCQTSAAPKPGPAAALAPRARLSGSPGSATAPLTAPCPPHSISRRLGPAARRDGGPDPDFPRGPRLPRGIRRGGCGPRPQPRHGRASPGEQAPRSRASRPVSRASQRPCLSPSLNSLPGLSPPPPPQAAPHRPTTLCAAHWRRAPAPAAPPPQPQRLTNTDGPSPVWRHVFPPPLLTSATSPRRPSRPSTPPRRSSARASSSSRRKWT